MALMVGTLLGRTADWREANDGRSAPPAVAVRDLAGLVAPEEGRQRDVRDQRHDLGQGTGPSVADRVLQDSVDCAEDQFESDRLDLGNVLEDGEDRPQ